MSTAGRFRGRRALVTGGNRGIGTEVVRLLRDLGLEMFLGSRDLDAGSAAATSLGLTGVTPVPIDVADPSSVAAARDSLAPAGIDVLVNSAAGYPMGRVTFDEADQAR